jgi:hypothetical protein
VNYRQGVFIALAALAVGGATASGSSAATTRAAAAGCAAKMTFLVWPHGHPAIPLVGFANLATPHVEIYSGSGAGHSGSHLLSWAAGGKTAEPSPSTTPACISVSTPPKTLKPIGTMREVASTTAVTCTFPASASIDIERVSGGTYRYRLRVVLPGGRLAAQTDVTPAGVKLRYPAKLCHTVATPAP